MDRIKNNDAGMHSDVYKSISFLLGMMVDIIVLYILTLIYLTLIFIQGYRSVRKQKILHQWSQSLSICSSCLFCFCLIVIQV